MKILFVDNKTSEFERFLDLPFAKGHKSEIEHVKSPVGLAKRVDSDPDIRLVILDILWEQDEQSDALELGADAMRELAETVPEVPVIIYSIIDDQKLLSRLIPEMMRLGAYDWVSKDESAMIRSFRIERAYMAGRDKTRMPGRRGLLAADAQRRQNVHAAVMFVDMSGFTALTNEIGANEVVQVLREFYNLVCQAVVSNKGYVDKFIGDAVMAVFGATGTSDSTLYNHGQNCIQSARVVQAKSSAFRIDVVEPLFRQYNVRHSAEVQSRIGMLRIGMESGVVDVVRFEKGNESEVTLIGTPVNIASRILAQAGVGEIWAGENLHSTGTLGSQVMAEEEVQYKNLPGHFKKYKIQV